MILREATIKYKGYDPDDLSHSSEMRVCISCDECGRVRWTMFSMRTDLCRSCSKKRFYKPPPPKQLSENDRFIEGTQINRIGTIKRFGYDPVDLRIGSQKPIVVTCKECCEDRVTRMSDHTVWCRSCAQLGERHHQYGKPRSDETKIKIGKGNMGKIVSDETRKKQSASQIGKRRGTKHTIEAKKRMSRAQTGNNNGFYGKRHTNESKIKMSCTQRGVDIEDFDGFKYKNRKNVRFTSERNEWRNNVFKRDNYTCQMCNTYNGYLEAHHIYMLSKYPELGFDIDNGITLCKECHKQLRGYEDEYIDMCIMLMN